jgi:four helix bundle protein
MGAHTIEELVAWQLANELRLEVIAFTANLPARRDFKYCAQIRDAADSAGANTAEGFERKNDGDFVRFLAIARGSLGEVRDRLISGHARRFLGEETFARLTSLSRRALAANTRLQQYLDTCREAKQRGKRGPSPPRPSPVRAAGNTATTGSEDPGPKT